MNIMIELVALKKEIDLGIYRQQLAVNFKDTSVIYRVLVPKAKHKKIGFCKWTTPYVI